MTTIDAIVFSYKGKKTLQVIENLLNNTINKINITLIDKHPLDRSKKFLHLENFSYFHDFWDYQTSPISIKSEIVQNSGSEYTLLITDDIAVSYGWDEKLTDKVGDSIISGTGILEISQPDKFFISKTYKPSKDYSLTNFIDRNFIFCKNSVIKNIPFPVELKYYGEEEMLSLEAFCRGYDIFSAPEGTYQDSRARALETLFAPFSLEHNYNLFVDTIKNKNANGKIDVSSMSRSVEDFIKFHRIDTDLLTKLPFQKNDVTYSPYSMKMDMHENVGGRRFMGNFKTIE
jgi:hypothetical protein